MLHALLALLLAAAMLAAGGWLALASSVVLAVPLPHDVPHLLGCTERTFRHAALATALFGLGLFVAGAALGASLCMGALP